MRIDKLLCELNIGSRSEVKVLLKKGLITVNGEKLFKPETKIDEKTAVVSYKGKEFRYQPFVYYMMNKPAGVITATKDTRDKTVLDLMPEIKRETFPMGRLDKDTEGLLILTDDGALAHRLLSPAHHVDKVYEVDYEGELPKTAVEDFARGLDIGERRITKTARLELVAPGRARLTISEGKFHQVKRMFEKVGCNVTYLKRLALGNLTLDNLKPGEYRKLTESEIEALHK